MSKRLEGKVALVTGGSRGIGKAVVERFAEEGAKVAFTYLSTAPSEEDKKHWQTENWHIKAYLSDASSHEAVHACVEQVLSEYGRVDVLVNNAGITEDNLLARMTKEMWDQVIRVNLTSCFNTIQALTKSFMRQRSGSIVNLTSVVGLRGNAGQANYAASKAGIVGLTKSVALELGGRHVRCNAVAPGFIQTDMTQSVDEKTSQAWAQSIPLRRIGQPQDVAQACVFLASDESSYITGQVLQVDGGMLT